MARVGRDLKDHESPHTSPLQHRQGRQLPHLILLDQAAQGQGPSNLALNTFRDGASTTSLGSLFQHLATLIVKNFPLTSNLNLPSLNLKPFPLVLLFTHSKS